MANKKNKRVAIYIDGSNFYHYVKNLKDQREVSFSGGKKLDFEAFVKFLLADKDLVSARYYVGIFRNVDQTKKSQDLVIGQQRFLAQLENLGFVIKRGKIMYDSGKPREKGTDVKIATDMIVGAADDLYDIAVIVSSDTDLIPALQYVRHKGKVVEYIGFSHSPSFGMQKNADLSRLLSPTDIKGMIK